VAYPKSNTMRKATSFAHTSILTGSLPLADLSSSPKRGAGPCKLKPPPPLVASPWKLHLDYLP
jgi:hypothetical protein